MISTRLNANGRPYWATDDTGGRFIACRAGFYDPAVFEKNREVSFTGRIDGYENRRIGGYDYRFRSEEHTSELQSLMRISYAVFCLKKKKKYIHIIHI